MTKPAVKYHELLSGKYEPAPKATTVPDFAFNPATRTGELYEPVIDKKWIENHQPPQWPEDKRFAVCLTHDVDTVSELNLQQNLRIIWKLLKTHSQRPVGESLRRVFEHKLNAFRGLLGRSDQLCKFEKWMDLEKEHGARSTFFFAPESVYLPHRSDCMYRYDQKIQFFGATISVAELMRTMDQEGWEIGLHPSWNAHADLAEMKYQKEQIESVLGHSIQSVRQHFLKYDLLNTHRVQSLAGFKYDSTIGFNDNVGFRRGTSYPFNCFDLNEGKKLPLLQIPLIAQDGALLDPGKGLRLDQGKAVEYIKLMVQEVKEVGGVLTLSWHPHTMNRPAYWDVYKEVLELLEKEDPWFATVSEAGAWWANHVDIDLLKFTKEISTK